MSSELAQRPPESRPWRAAARETPCGKHASDLERDCARRLRRRPVASAVAAVGALALLPAVALAAASMHAPSTAAIGSRITVRAGRLDAGRYTLVLAIETRVVDDTVTSCFARVGSSRISVAGRVTITGKLPTRLACYQGGRGPNLGHFNVRPGRYVLSLGVFMPPAGFAYNKSFVKRPIRLTG